MNYLKLGEKPDPSKCSHSHVKGRVEHEGATWLACAFCRALVHRIPDAVQEDTEATMRRVMEKWLRGS